MLCMGNPSAHAALDLLVGYRALLPSRAQPPQPVAEATDIFFRQSSAPDGQEDEAEECRALVRCRNPSLAGMGPQPSTFEEVRYPVLPFS